MITVRLSKKNEGMVLEAVTIDRNDDFIKWKYLRSKIVSSVFKGRSVAIVTESPQKYSWVCFTALKKSLPNYELVVSGERYVVALVDSVPADMLSDITFEEDFSRSLLWIFDVNCGTKEAIHNTIIKRLSYPTAVSEWLSCDCEFVLCEDDGATIVWSGSKMQLDELKEMVQLVCKEKVCDISISMG